MRIPAMDRFLAVLGYLPFLFWVPIVGRRDSIFAQFHGRQSFVLWLLWFVPVVILFVLLAVLGQTNSVWVFSLVFLLTAVYLFMVLVGVLKTLVRERYRMPVVADVALFMRL